MVSLFKILFYLLCCFALYFSMEDAQTNVFNRDLTIGIGIVLHRQTHQVDHAIRQIPNAHGLTHIQYEYVTATCH